MTWPDLTILHRHASSRENRNPTTGVFGSLNSPPLMPGLGEYRFFYPPWKSANQLKVSQYLQKRWVSPNETLSFSMLSVFLESRVLTAMKICQLDKINLAWKMVGFRIFLRLLLQQNLGYWRQLVSSTLTFRETKAVTMWGCQTPRMPLWKVKGLTIGIQ